MTNLFYAGEWYSLAESYENTEAANAVISEALAAAAARSRTPGEVAWATFELQGGDPFTIAVTTGVPIAFRESEPVRARVSTARRIR